MEKIDCKKNLDQFLFLKPNLSKLLQLNVISICYYFFEEDTKSF